MQISWVSWFFKKEHAMENSGKSAHMVETTIEIEFKPN